MKYIIAVLLSAVFAALTVPQAPALTNSVAHKDSEVKPTAKSVTVSAPVQPQPEVKQAVDQKTTTPVPVAQGCDNYLSTFSQYGWDVTVALAVCKAESGGNISALSMTGDRGLMQINSVHADMVDGNLNALYDPTTNISVAYRVYLSQGWNGWSAYKSGAYLRYL